MRARPESGSAVGNRFVQLRNPDFCRQDDLQFLIVAYRYDAHVIDRKFAPLESPTAGIADIRELLDCYGLARKSPPSLGLFVLLRAQAPPHVIRNAAESAIAHLNDLTS